jgi:diguanylate cyclase (GGDEF)-like protein
VRKRIAIAGHSEEGLSLIPLLEANPDVEVVAILSDDPGATEEALDGVGPGVREAYAPKVTSDPTGVLKSPGLVAVIEADPSGPIRSALEEAADYGVQRTTPLVAKLLYAFGPIDAYRKPELLQTLGEILESYNLTIDRKGILARILQIAVGSTGAERGSLMLYDPDEGNLRVEVAIGIERELIPKIRVAPGEGIAGRAFEERRPLLLTGKADWRTYRITRERDDVESALSVPLVYNDRALGVLNLAHTKQRGTFTDEDLAFVEQLSRVDAKIIARAEEYHALQRDSLRLRAESEVRRLLGSPEPLRERLNRVCRFLATDICRGIAHLYLRDPELDELTLQASSLDTDPLASALRLRTTDGVVGWAVREGRATVLCRTDDETLLYYAVLPLGSHSSFLGVLTVEGAQARPQSEELVRESLDAAAQGLARELTDRLREVRIEREATRMGAITEAGAQMSAARDSGELARAVSSSAAMILEAEHAVLRLRDEPSERYQIRSYFGSAETETQERLLALEKDLAIEAIQSRSTVRITRLEERAGLNPEDVGVNCIMTQPLTVDGRLLGTLSVLNKVARDPLVGERFGHDDEKVLVRFSEHASQALSSVLGRERARHRERFDSVTGLSNVAHLRERLEEELARASAQDRPVALVHMRVTGLEEFLTRADPEVGDQLLISVARELRASLREYDVAARTGPESFAAILPEPEGDVAEALGPIARRVGQALQRELEALGGESLPLEFGYATCPEDATTARALEERARDTRIRSL